jgi:hypothetical protein
MRWDMVVRPPPVPGTGYATAYPIEECPVEAVIAIIATAA